jgi:hypothetical protein
VLFSEQLERPLGEFRRESRLTFDRSSPMVFPRALTEDAALKPAPRSAGGTKSFGGGGGGYTAPKTYTKPPGGGGQVGPRVPPGTKLCDNGHGGVMARP